MSVRVPFVDLGRQYTAHKDEFDATFQRVAASGGYILGDEVAEFEKGLAEICNVPYALTVANGTDSMILGLRALGIGPGDEVITAPNSFIASAGAIAAVGATIVFADCREDHNIDPVAIEKAITPKTKAIIPVHLTGRPCAMDGINAIAAKHNLYVIEDAAQAIGAKYKGRPVGSFGTMGSFSLHPLKNLFVMGDGGFISLSDKELYEKMKIMRNHGLINRDDCMFWALNSRLDALHCAIGRVKLKYFDAITARFREIAEMYRKGLQDIVDVPRDTPDEFAVYHNFVITVDRRDELQAYLNTIGVETKIHYPVLLHLQPAAKHLGYKHGDFPVAEKMNKRQLSLPIFPELRQEEIDAVIAGIRSFYESNKELKSGTGN